MTSLYFLGWVISRGSDLRTSQIMNHCIIYFRPFADNTANYIYHWNIEPVLACFGPVYEVASYHSFPIDPLNSIMNKVRRTPNRLGAIDLDNNNWRADAIELIKKAQFVIIDLSTANDNVLWEFNTSVSILGRQNIIAIAADHTVFHYKNMLNDVCVLISSSPSLKKDVSDFFVQKIGMPKGIDFIMLNSVLKRGRTMSFNILGIVSTLLKTIRDGINFKNISDV